jgi:glycosyltransferase involved in cell wall biosynthesis
MKIALIVPGGVDRSGAERVIPCILWLIERLVAAGDEVHVFSFNHEPHPARWKLLGASVHNAGWRPRALMSLGQILAEHHRGAFDVLHAFWAQSCGVTGALAARLLRRPLLLTLPGGDVVRLPEIGYGGLMRKSGAARLAFAARRASFVTAPSQFMCALAAENGIEALHLPLGVALDRWPARLPRRRDIAAPIRLLHVASLNRVKDQDTLLRAMALLRDLGVLFELEIIGADTLKGAIQRSAIAQGLTDLVRFTEFLPHRALRLRVERADLLVMSSRHEAGPLVTLEAAMSGVPTAGTTVGHIADFAPDAAVAVPPGDAGALAEAIRRLAHDEELRLDIAAAAQKRSVAMDADFTARSFRSLYAAAPTSLGSGSIKASASVPWLE